MRKGEIAAGSLSGLSFLAAFDAYAGTGTSSWLADLCLSGDTSAPMIEGMPMEDHTQHAAYFASAGLTFLAVALGWEYIETRVARMFATEPTGLARKRLLAVLIFIIATSERPRKSAVVRSFETLTGHVLPEEEAEHAFRYLMREDAPDLSRILAGASTRQRRLLLRAAVQTWSAHGMDSDQATRVTECIVELLGFEQDAICRTLDRLWLEDRARTGFSAICRIAVKVSHLTYRASMRALKTSIAFLAPHARQIGARARATIQRRHLPLSR